MTDTQSNLCSEQHNTLLARRHLHTVLLTSLHLKHFPRNTQVLNVEGSSNYLYVLKKKTVYDSFKKNPDVFLNKGKSIIKLKLDLIHLLNIFQDFSLLIFDTRKTSLVSIKDGKTNKNGMYIS